MRHFWRAEAGGALLAVSLTACAPGRLPPASAARPLSPPMGEHQLTAGLRFEPRPTVNEDDEDAPVYDFAYRYGVTDSLSYQFPLRGGYAWRLDEHSIAISCGAGDLGWSEDWAKRFRGDPRLPNTMMRAFTWSGVGSLAGKLALPVGAVVATAEASQVVFNAQARDRAASLFVAWQIDAGPRVSVAVGGAMRLEQTWYLDETASAIVVGGRGSDGYAPVPVLVLHASAVVDVFVSPELRFEPRGRERELALWLGIDVHGVRRKDAR